MSVSLASIADLIYIECMPANTPTPTPTPAAVLTATILGALANGPLTPDAFISTCGFNKADPHGGERAAQEAAVGEAFSSGTIEYSARTNTWRLATGAGVTPYIPQGTAKFEGMTSHDDPDERLAVYSGVL